MTQTAHELPPARPGETLAWRVHLLAERPFVSAVVIAFLATIFLIVLVQYGPLFAAVTIYLLGTSLASFLFPTHYELTPEGPRRRILFMRSERRWVEFRDYAWDDRGARLSTTRHRTRFQRRDFHLRFHGNREEVLAYLSRYIEKEKA